MGISQFNPIRSSLNEISRSFHRPGRSVFSFSLETLCDLRDLCCLIPIKPVKRQPRGWSADFGNGRSRPALRAINRFVYQRVVKHLKRRSQRPYRPPQGVSWYDRVHNKLGLERL